MICAECNGRGETIYYVEIDRDENTVTVEQRKCTRRTCNGSGKQPMTKADYIRSMSDEELTTLIRAVINVDDCPATKDTDCDNCFFRRLCQLEYKCVGRELEWLQQPVEE